jgi:hypothetical protein
VAGKSPGGKTVVTVISGVVHGSILKLSGAAIVWGLKNKTPGREADRGFGKLWQATRLKWAPVGYQARQWLNQYPK